jgi:arsenite methyltransferase
MEILLYVAGTDERQVADALVRSVAPPDGLDIRVIECTGDVLADASDPEQLPLVTIDGVEAVVGRMPSDEEFEWLVDNASTAQALARGETLERPERFSVPRRIHINMHVHDLTQSVAFYEVLLSAKPIKRRADYAKFELEDPPVNLALEQVSLDKPEKVDHLGIEVKTADAVMEHRARYREAGFKLTEELHVECCYSEQNKIWAIAPSGIRWEVVNVVGDVESPQACAPDCICWSQFDKDDRSYIANQQSLPTVETETAVGEAAAARVQQVYETVAQSGESSLCCDPGALYSEEELADLPDDVRALSSGCGNPVRLSRIEPGQTVVDVGSGAGTDAILAGRLTGPTGHVIGVDPAPSMRERAGRAAADLHLDWVTFLEGTAEQLPVETASADVVVSNCVLSMSARSATVWAEIARVLRPGGSFVISDTVGSVSADTPEARARCEVGLTWPEYVDQFRRAGLGSIAVLEAGTVQYRDGNRVQTATITGRRLAGRPHTAVQLFVPHTADLIGQLQQALTERGLAAEVTQHDRTDIADEQLLTVLLDEASDPNPSALLAFADGEFVGSWRTDETDTGDMAATIAAVVDQRLASAGPAGPATAGTR